MLELKNVSKRFGGVVATDDITLDVKRGEVHALIGPNGAGKTTLIGQISGSLGSDSGEILFEGRDITQATQHVRVRAGLARSYQITSLFRRFTVLDNLALAVQAGSGSSFSFWRPVSKEALLLDEARAPAKSGSPSTRPRSRPRSRTANSARSKWAWRSPPTPGSCSSTSRWRAWDRKSRRT